MPQQLDQEEEKKVPCQVQAFPNEEKKVKPSRSGALKLLKPDVTAQEYDLQQKAQKSMGCLKIVEEKKEDEEVERPGQIKDGLDRSAKCDSEQSSNGGDIA